MASGDRMSATPRQPLQEVILDSVADGVFTVDRAWRITSFNRAAERITGVPRHEALGRLCWEVFHADVCENDCVLRATLSSGTPCVNRTVHIVNRAGARVPISISTGILRDERGRVIGGVETFRDLSEIEHLRLELLGSVTRDGFVTADHRITAMFDTLPAIAAADTPVLVLGESGTGKELLARAVHAASPRATAPFVPVNCGALPENLMESELFGYRKGAFTDAKADKPGRFDRAAGGTLFLDEIAELSRPLQVKLLRVLQEKTYEPLGAVESVIADVRVIAATNRDIEAMLASGEFRRDLYYRIGVLTLRLPPLRDRPGDIPLLIQHLLQRYNARYGRTVERVSPDALARLSAYDYPGNVRELENILQHALVLCPGSVIELAHLPDLPPAARPSGPSPAGRQSRQALERREIEEALARNRFSRSRTARDLNMHVTTLWRRMKRLGMKT